MAADTPLSPGASRTYWQLVALYAVSGLTSVAYEVLWTRMLSLQFGVSIFAVVITVAAFMGGLGAGSIFMARRAHGVTNPLRLLAFLEGGIALYALMLPTLIKYSAGMIEQSAAQFSLSGWYALIAATALCLLLIPAFAMGAGFSLVLAALGNRAEHLGVVYGLNTLGAAIGALLPLGMLPAVGLTGATRLIAALGLLVAVALLSLSSRFERTEIPPVKESHKPPPFAALVSYAGIGAASLVLEIAWTRLFGMVMLRTEYVLAIILATFLMGIGLGSLAARHMKKPAWFTLLPIAAGAFSLISLLALPALSRWVERTEYASLLDAMTAQGVALALLTLPVTLALGAWLPLLNRRLNGGGLWLYGANSLGAAAGAFTSGLLLIPYLGSTGTVVAAALALLVLGLTLAKPKTVAWLAVPLFLAAAWPLKDFPDVSTLLPKVLAGSSTVYLYEDAISMTHVAEQADGQRLLLTDLQRMDASTEPTAVFVQSNQARLPLLLHPDPRTVLFLGLGTGISDAGSLPFPGLQRSAVELSQGAIVSAQRWFAPLNHDALRQTHVVRDDARHFLNATPDKYDVIIGDVFHPDLAGHGSLLALQQFLRAREHLTENGVFVQWLALNQFDPASLDIIFRTFKQAFPDAQLFLDGMHLALVGPRGKFLGAPAVFANLQRMTHAVQEAATAGEGGYTWLGRYWGPLAASPGPVQDEWSPVLEFRLPRARYAGGMEVSSVLRMLLKKRPDMEEAAARLNVPEEKRRDFERAYGATEFMVRSWLFALQGGAQQANHLKLLAYQANAKDRWIAYALADTMFESLPEAREHGLSEEAALQEILRLNPQHVESLRALWHIKRAAHDPGAEVLRQRLLELSPLDSEARMGS